MQLHLSHMFLSFMVRTSPLKRLKRKLHPSAFKRIYTGAIRPKMEYACTVWSGGPTSKLVDLQRTFCRRHNIQLPSLQKRFDYLTLALFFKVRIHQAPNSLYKLLPPPSSSSGYTFRKISYPVPAVNRSSTLKSFLPRAIILWNALPVELQAMKSVHSFKAALRNHLKLV